MCVDEREKAVILSQKIQCICPEIKKVEREAKIDQLIWRMVGVAHELIEMKEELNHYYPEFISFLNYLVTTYPALKERK